MMAMTSQIRSLILKECSTGQIREAACQEGMRSLSEDGWRLVGEGVTTINEILRVSKNESSD